MHSNHSLELVKIRQQDLHAAAPAHRRVDPEPAATFSVAGRAPLVTRMVTVLEGAAAARSGWSR